jgi:hypothetical protein
VLTHASYSLAGGSLPPPAPPLGNLNKVILSEKKQERCYDLDTVQAGMPMTVKVMRKQAFGLFPFAGFTTKTRFQRSFPPRLLDSDCQLTCFPSLATVQFR